MLTVEKNAPVDQRTGALQVLRLYREKVLAGIFGFSEKDTVHAKKKEFTRCDHLIDFIERQPACFYRSNAEGHVTASALVTDIGFTSVLLTYHAKLKKWLQLGGHCDGDGTLHRVAWREAKEESGLERLAFFNLSRFPEAFSFADERDFHAENAFAAPESFALPLPFDVDIHHIPLKGEEKEHMHYDVRYLLQASQDEKILISEESLDLRWIPLEQVSNYTDDQSTLRQIEKLRFLISRGHTL